MKAGSSKKGVYVSTIKSGQPSYRASITYKSKHISLGSYSSSLQAEKAYKYAKRILDSDSYSLSRWRKNSPLPFEKCVILSNFKDHGIYFATPIYLEKKYFNYYLSPAVVLTFDTKDLFYYSLHKIMKRGSHLFVADYGSQVNVLSRYGIKSFSVPGRDYLFINGNSNDLRYENIEVLNRYNGVRQYNDKGFVKYKAVIHVIGDYIIGKYESENEAAIAYNKAADILAKNGFTKNFVQNYIEELGNMQYAEIYTNVAISPKLYKLKPLEGK